MSRTNARLRAALRDCISAIDGLKATLGCLEDEVSPIPTCTDTTTSVDVAEEAVRKAEDLL